MFGKIKFAAFFIAGTAGVIWVVNLPYPMIRKPVAQVAPILLLPSFMSMDHNYRGAIDALEQADQLISRATSTADIELGGEKVKAAKKHLDNLPVWFLGYYPQRYCTLFSCSWQFTLDEFQQARERVARLDAVVFQDKNAIVPFNEAKNSLETAKQQYAQAKDTKERETAIANWQIAIDKLDQISQQTLAGKTAQRQLIAYKRDFENARISSFITAAQEFDLEAQKIQPTNSQVAAELWQQAISRLERVPNENPQYVDAQKLIASYQVKQKTVIDPRSTTLIAAAKQYALAAAQASQNPPHTVQKWEQIADLWKKAIQQLENVQVSETSYVEAQKLIAQYQTNLGTIQNRRQAESEGKEILDAANKEIQSLIASPPSNKNEAKAEIIKVMNQLSNVKSGTTSYNEAQRLLKLADNQVKKLQ
ncbi:hypothetical protein [Sphaerospermopsis sp. LEGE 08334]|uniref:hypothetical protein n=1 Tax=Sphaerospermopsis sp. LEGE 08334 TaxID=1828651 RepID=UPI00187FF12F|nr:hypothetical protein [Sphaerospermopsis sp. LEGE 08334]MBE9056623.1 hypothetical protein [Sphaerospermopsis sp. LEGE 08334]